MDHNPRLSCRTLDRWPDELSLSVCIQLDSFSAVTCPSLPANRWPRSELTSHISPWSGRRRCVCVCVWPILQRYLWPAVCSVFNNSGQILLLQCCVSALFSKRAFRRNIVILGAGRCRGGGIVRVHLCLRVRFLRRNAHLRPALLEITGFFLCVTLSPCLKHCCKHTGNKPWCCNAERGLGRFAETGRDGLRVWSMDERWNVQRTLRKRLQLSAAYDSHFSCAPGLF